MGRRRKKSSAEHRIQRNKEVVGLMRVVIMIAFIAQCWISFGIH